MKDNYPNYLRDYLNCATKQQSYMPHSSAQELFEWFNDRPLSKLDQAILHNYNKHKKYAVRLTGADEQLIVTEVAPHLAHKSRRVLINLLGNVRSRAFIRQLREVQGAVIKPDADTLQDFFAQLLTVNPTDIVNVHKYNCRFCYGENHQYQWTLGEYTSALQEYDKAVSDGAKNPPAPAYGGGMGFIANRDPNPTCPECAGLGRDRVVIADTRTLSPAARLLIEEISQDRYGCVKIKFADRLRIATELGKIIGIYKGLKLEDTPATGDNPSGESVEEMTTKELIKRGNAYLASKSSVH